MTSVRSARLGASGVLALLVIGAAVVRRLEPGPPAPWTDDAWVALISRHALGLPSRARWAPDGDAELILYQRAPGR